MDDAKWSQDRYNEIKSEVGKYLKGVGYKDADKVRFTPSSGLRGAARLGMAFEGASASAFSPPVP